ncbi:MAG: zinc-dependent metalloprotease family protein [Planctomycetaceae bacterium]
MASATSGPVYPLSSIPALHSNSGAAATLYLDFDGHFEATWGGYTNVTTPVYDFDGDRLSFSDAELANIQAIWFRVAEDYAPFNIDVTTVEPPVLAAGTPIADANGIALRIAIGGVSTDWYGPGIGGVAYINSFTNSIANVAYVFAQDKTTPYWPGDVVSHESGHAFGLQHQSSYDVYGNKLQEYNPGNASWHPLMGSVATTAISTWYNGTSSQGATTYQDDMGLIAGATNGFGYYSDDYGDTTATAAALSQAGNTWSGTGLVGTNTDADMFSLTVTTEDTYRVTVSGLISPYGDLYASNLDAALELRDSAGVLIGTASPSGTTSAELRKGLTPGTYFVGVKSSGTYGWVGRYSINVDAPPAGVIVTPASKMLNTSEEGSQTSFSVALQTQPTADVTVPISSSNTAEGTVSTASLVFTSDNWDTPQTVTITGVNDTIVDNDAAYSVILGAASSDDLEYSLFNPADIAVVNIDNDVTGFVYSVDFGNGTINRSRLSGSQPEKIVDLTILLGPSFRTKEIATDAAGNKIYWTATDSSTLIVIQRANLDVSNVETLVSTPYLYGGFRGITLDSAAGKMYWIDNGAHKIQRANLNGTQIQDIVVSTGTDFWAMSLALDPAAGKVYWTDFGAGTQNAVRRANMEDGTNIEVLWTSIDARSPTGIALDVAVGKMYWADQTQDVIRRANLDGTNVEVVVNNATLFGNSQVLGLTLDAPAGKLYWTDNATKTIYRANLDGSMIVILASGSGLEGVATAHPGPQINVTPGTGLITTEEGASDILRVTLTSQLTANVTISLSHSDPTEGTLSTASLTFTPANWDITQTVTVTGIADSLLDGDIAYTITLAPAVSDDPVYNGVNPADVTVVNRDKAALQTKFYVVDDASKNKTFEYNAYGGSVESYNLNSGNSAPRGAASTIAGDKLWVVDANRNVYVYNRSGGLLGAWTAGALPNVAVVEGIATNGIDVWIVEAKSDKVYRYAGAATRLSGSQTFASSFSLTGGNASPKDITTNGVDLWVVNDSTTDKVFKYTVSGTLLGSWTIDAANSRPTGLTIDPANVSNIWIVDSGTDKIYQYNGTAIRTTGSQAASATWVLAYGNGNPQGIADPPPQSGMLGAGANTFVGPDSGSSAFVPPVVASSSWSPQKKVSSDRNAPDSLFPGQFTEFRESADLFGQASSFDSSKKPASKRIGKVFGQSDQILSSPITGAADVDDLFADWNADPLRLLLSDAKFGG